MIGLAMQGQRGAAAADGPFGNPLLRAGFRDVAVPEPISYAPQTPAWYVLFAILLALLVWSGWRLRRRWLANRYRRDALTWMSRIDSRLGDPSARVEALREIPFVLKEAALAAFPRTDVAGLTGARWLAFLDETLGRGSREFVSGAGEQLASLSYAPDAVLTALSDERARAVAALSRRWLEGHRVRV